MPSKDRSQTIRARSERLSVACHWTRVNLTKDMRKDMLVPAGLLIMLVFLFVCFRQARGVTRLLMTVDRS